ncbi:MAG: polymer-forming cytoskeletal protein [Burkholderiales bacterium]|nr:polymer-forming cytoskeletal protein [Anaerolineae bacterium]
MQSRWKLLFLGCGVIALIALANGVRQRVFQHGAEALTAENITFTQSYQLTDTLNDDVVVMAEAIDLSNNSLVEGDAALMGSAVTVSGDVNGDLTVMGETFTLGPDAHIMGDALLLVNHITLDGRVDGDLIIQSDDLTVNPGAALTGEVSTCADSLTDNRSDARPLVNCADGFDDWGALESARRNALLSLHPGADSFDVLISPPGSDNSVKFELPNLETLNTPRLWWPMFAANADGASVNPPALLLPMSMAALVSSLNEAAASARVYVEPQVSGENTMFGLLFSALGSLTLSGIAILTVTLFPRQIRHIEDAVRMMPRGAGSIGLMLGVLATGVTLGVGLLVAAVPPVGLIVLPLYLVGALLLLGMMVAGWISLSLIVGDWLLQRFTRSTFPPLVTVAIGTMALFAAAHLVALLPFGIFVVLLVILLVGSIGLGAALTTRMGTRPLRRYLYARSV